MSCVVCTLVEGASLMGTRLFTASVLVLGVKIGKSTHPHVEL